MRIRVSPTYADLRTAAHLQTFDVRDGGAALWGDGGKLFLVNVLHQNQAKAPKELLLKHVTLDPPLQPHEAAEVEQVKLNASGSQILLLAKSWIKVLRLPAENKQKPQSLQRRAENSSTQRFLVRFEDGSEQEVTLKEDELKEQSSIAEQVKRRASPGKRVAFVSREKSVAAVRAVGYFSNVRHAVWHPLSDTHLVVLSDAEEIEVFNTQQDVSKPEQRHRLDFPTKARHVELILLDAPIRPQWRSNRQSAAANATRKLPALLLECLNLGIDDSGGKAVLERDIADPRLVYCLHSTGVHVINVSWVFALASGKQFTALPKSSVRHVFSVSPSNAGASTAASSAVSNVVGARVVKNVNFGHLLLLRLASGSFEVVNVSAASSELLKGVLADSSNSSPENIQNTLPDTLASMASSKSRASIAASSDNSGDGGIRPFGDIVEEKLEALSARGTRVTGNTLMHEVDDAVLAFVLERVKILYEDVEYVDEMDQLMRDRLQLHATMIKTQAEKVVEAQKNANDVSASMKNLQEKLERALAVQQNLSKRAAAVLQAVKENQPHLSRAECEFKSELELMAVEVRRMKPRVAELTVQGQRAVRSLENAALSASSSRRYWSPISAIGGSSVLSNDKKKMCYDVLRAETQLIDDTKVLLEDLSANLQQLKE
ncbi:Cleavage stimulation factor subunit 2 [Phytophthora nicotianae]|uniref:Cleavage stimulation factor subunit 2 n=1 Tax=Phytophthora nicotianae TaxID=4792 RepID=A0A0W8DU05_PHYNI|nr:Cleavage stimulation factor subunit 2 [Phytophthora nicotianae]